MLVPLPISDTFGLGRPPSGFLEAWEVGWLSSLIPREHLGWLEERAVRDEEARSVKSWMESMRDVTPEERDEQLQRQREWLEGMAHPARRPHDD